VPTEATYLAAAIALERASSDADELVRDARDAAAHDALRGGALTAAVRFAIERIETGGTAVASALRSAADACRWRAEQCRLYDDELARWHQLDDAYVQAVRTWQALSAAHRASWSVPDPGAPPTAPAGPPSRPHPWIA